MKTKRLIVRNEDLLKLFGMPEDSFVLDAYLDNESGVSYFMIGSNRFPDKETFEATQTIMFKPKKEKK